MSNSSPVKWLSLFIGAISLTACVHTEPRLTVPHINLSPNTVFGQTKPSSETVIDFGIDVSANESDSLENLEVLPGVRTRRVDNNSSAAAAELKAGDVILSVNDVATNNPDTFNALLQNAKAGEALSLKVRRDTTVFTTSLVGQTRTEANIEELYRADPVMSRAGFRTVVVTADDKSLTGAEVVEIFEKSPLPAAAIEIDQTIITVDGLAVESAQGLVEYLLSRDFGDKVAVQVVDQQNNLSSKTVTLWNPGRRLSRLTLWPLIRYSAELSPSTTNFSLVKVGPISLFEYQRDNTEKSYRLFTFFRFGTGVGELSEEMKGE